MAESGGVQRLVESLSVRLKSLTSLFGRVDRRDVAVFLEQLGIMLENGLAPGNAIWALSEQQDDPRLAEVLEGLNLRLQKGWGLSAAMMQRPDVFTPTTIMLVKAGEQGGDLAGRLRRAGELVQRSNDLVAQVKKAISGPLITAGACALVMLGIVKFVLPKFLGLYDQMDLEVPLISKLVFGLVNFVNHPLTLLLLVLLVVLVLVFRDEIKERLFVFLLFLPGTRSLLGNLLCAGMCETMSFLHKDGVPLHRVLDMLVKTAPYRAHREVLEASRTSLINTGSLSEALSNIDYFPLSFHAMVAVGEESGSLDELLDASRRFMEDQVDMVLSRAATILEPLVISGMGVCMAFLFVGMFLPIYGILENIGGI